MIKDEDDEEDEEEEHLAPADSTTLPAIDLFPSAEDIEAFEIDESASTPTHTSPTYAEAPLGYRAAMIRSRATSPSPVPSLRLYSLTIITLTITTTTITCTITTFANGGDDDDDDEDDDVEEDEEEEAPSLRPTLYFNSCLTLVPQLRNKAFEVEDVCSYTYPY
ncbi:hypothetical protein Tco_1458241 [Tanacetum coccineum]